MSDQVIAVILSNSIGYNFYLWFILASTGYVGYVYAHSCQEQPFESCLKSENGYQDAFTNKNCHQSVASF